VPFFFSLRTSYYLSPGKTSGLFTKPFEGLTKGFEGLTKPFEGLTKLCGRLTKPFEGLTKLFEGLTKGFERLSGFCERPVGKGAPPVRRFLACLW
jgi:hypothetical protein